MSCYKLDITSFSFSFYVSFRRSAFVICQTILDRQIICSHQLEIETLAYLSSLTVHDMLCFQNICFSIFSFDNNSFAPWCWTKGCLILIPIGSQPEWLLSTANRIRWICDVWCKWKSFGFSEGSKSKGRPWKDQREDGKTHTVSTWFKDFTCDALHCSIYRLWYLKIGLWLVGCLFCQS